MTTATPAEGLVALALRGRPDRAELAKHITTIEPRPLGGGRWTCGVTVPERGFVPILSGQRDALLGYFREAKD